VVPPNQPFIARTFHEKHHPAIDKIPWDSPFMEKPAT
jgi:hypothetical protein